MINWAFDVSCIASVSYQKERN